MCYVMHVVANNLSVFFFFKLFKKHTFYNRDKEQKIQHQILRIAGEVKLFVALVYLIN